MTNASPDPSIEKKEAEQIWEKYKRDLELPEEVAPEPEEEPAKEEGGDEE